ncbi:5-formyltetrahydrofolate cyclo-ligase [Desulforamulus hydrothermalis]|uniref:5-formyltetrahydrofolate cyclo-ligase n=1 Tax=Desulforamulus hydrothermalis Lam5 = DSM 18033 TaxID=1121428 RepID=K8DYZ2_9FIRM|nr:5-formyltetrahydrofolate cyclo-ligase [Desulforamulus hydrothermalis]CCO08075.1 5-formyltetrahydrofolate cyclo-ligase [Desulforamulus hydrothermalis Lam5 = DSM 18033]SHG82608.1 5-formyltetrahydrofolate cyclo-ligase [Desulforamulus hydrothermalis Lam5 = DSM 18033]
MDKNTLRKQMLAARSSLTEQARQDKSRRITEQLLALPCYQTARTVMAYLDYRSEVATELLITHALQAGKRLAVPVVNRQDKTMLPSLLENFPQDLVPGPYGIRQPAPGSIRPVPVQELDLVLVPGVAFDARGNRLGYGGGYYDRFLPRLRPDARAVGLAYQLQLSGCLSSCLGPHDQPVHMVITEKGVLVCRPEPPAG